MLVTVRFRTLEQGAETEYNLTAGYKATIIRAA